jgi:hypothetical protein
MARAIAGLNKGYAHHPETLRWKGHSKAMQARHNELASEMVYRGFNHKSPWPDNVVNQNDSDNYPKTFWESLDVMRAKLLIKQGYLE